MARAHAENFLLLPPCGEMGPACSLSLAYPPAPTFSLIKHMQLHLWHPRFPFALALVSLAPFAPAATQLPQGVTREQMWYAPSAEDWQKPVQITFQRSWDDALALSKEQQRPILVCVNMDGEIASEHYAGVRYRLPEIAKLYEPYVCVIASVYRHNPRDYDEEGRRIPCPRFGCVTCGEHIAIEPMLYEKFMDGRRIAPRHIMVELDGSETYDVFYAWDTDSVFAQIQKGIVDRKVQAEPIVRGDKSILERVQSKDGRDRDAVEQAFATGEPQLKDSLLKVAENMGADAPVELLRLSVFGLDIERANAARRALAQTKQDGAVDLIGEALRAPMQESERQQLITALERLGETSPEARTLAVVHRGLSNQSGGVDVKGWAAAIEAQPAPEAADSYALQARIQRAEDAVQKEPRSAEQMLAMAESTLELGAHTDRAGFRNAREADRYTQLLFEDARTQARRATKFGLTKVTDGEFRAQAVLAAASWQLRDLEAAYAAAEAAAKLVPKNAGGYAAMLAMQIFAEARQNAIVAAIRDKKPWEPQWLTEVHTAYSVLEKHPLGQDYHFADHYDFVKALGGKGPASAILDAGLARFPASAPLHQRLRTRILEEQGAEALEATYTRMLQQTPNADLAYYAGYATMVVAEASRRRGESDAALTAYDRAIAHFRDCAAKNPTNAGNADHYVAMAHAGRSRVLLEQGLLAPSTQELITALRTKPEATATFDGLNLSASDTARMLRTMLKNAKLDDQLEQLLTALKDVDPELLKLPAYEFQNPNDAPQNGGPARGGR